uniref:E3 ubiquitin-protein ligase CHFR n=1 Tax=Pan paniscus TaxID=9597 RepID=A0A2R9ACS9_PANPA
ESEPHVLLRKREWTIGRRRGCDLSFPSNKLVSGDHCRIVVDEKSGQVTLEDTSTSGTVINKLKVVKKQTCPLQTGDVIYLVYRKNEPEHRSGGGGISPKGSGPSVASDEVSSFASALPDRKTASFLSLEPQDQEDLEPVKKKMRGDGDLDLNGQLLVAQPCRNAQTVHEDVRAAAGKPDKMEETLTCIICQDLLHDCVKSRSEEDVQSMDARNKITQDMLQPKVRRSFSDEEGSSEDLLELSDVDSESSDISQPYVVCRQCPEYRRQAAQPPHCPAPEGEPGAPQALGDAPSTSVSLTTAVQDYVCPLQGSHALCTCCFQPMPDRRAEREQDPRVAPQQCAVCLQPFCHLYWGCTRTGCYGCLAPFCELNLGDKCLDGVLNNNSYESDILKNYLATRGLTWKNMLTESLVALQRGVFLLSDYRVTGDTVLCYCCGLRSFRELTYQYRQNIPASELPVAVTSRPDCYWGRNCRTQVKAHHAMKFNHICEQTRFKS